MSAKQQCVHRSKTCCQTLKHFDNVFATGRNNIVEVFESLAVTQFSLLENILLSSYKTKLSSYKHIKSSFKIITLLLSSYEMNIKLSTLESLFSLWVKAFGENNHLQADNFQYSPHMKAIIV